MQLLSPAQVAGYFSFVLGITAYLQKTDHRLKFFNASQALLYALHFLLLGNLPAAASALVSSTRSFLALRFRSIGLAASIVAVSVAAGVRFARTPAGWLTVVASSVATLAIFMLTGVRLRLVLLGCTLAWLVNNLLSHSIGGVLLELCTAAINIATTTRLLRASNRMNRECTG
jgi:hypothetical protein